ncbi:hypothetical protein BY996DRAFT_6418309 [Phakopsora pachyrhizi]|nr:hypothetical protein BY996DRAFT_6418309 [Phakopsora pachyrhizi]
MFRLCELFITTLLLLLLLLVLMYCSLDNPSPGTVRLCTGFSVSSISGGCAGKDLVQVSCTASGPTPVTLSSRRIRMSCCWIDNITPVITNTCTTTAVVDIADTV